MKLHFALLLICVSTAFSACVRPLHPTGPHPHIDWLRENTEPEEFAYKLVDSPFIIDSSLFLTVGEEPSLKKRFVKCDFLPASETLFLQSATESSGVWSGESICTFVDALPKASELRGKMIYSSDYFPDPGLVDNDVQRHCQRFASTFGRSDTPDEAFIIVGEEMGAYQKRALLCIMNSDDATRGRVLGIPIDIPSRMSPRQKLVRGAFFPFALTADGVRIAMKVLIALPMAIVGGVWFAVSGP